MLAKLWNRYLRIWPNLIKSGPRFYSIAIALGIIVFASAIRPHSWLKFAAGWGALIALILLAIPEYFLPWDDQD